MMLGEWWRAFAGAGWRHAYWALLAVLMAGAALISYEIFQAADQQEMADEPNDARLPSNGPHVPLKLTVLNSSMPSVETEAPTAQSEETGPSSPDQAMQAEDDQALPLRARTSKAVRYRTWCVRLCDGYYFPMNYLTIRGRLRNDEEKCRASCSSETQLFVNVVVGRRISPLTDLSGRLYKDLPSAFAYRTAISSACSCDGSRMLVTSVKGAAQSGQ